MSAAFLVGLLTIVALSYGLHLAAGSVYLGEATEDYWIGWADFFGIGFYVLAFAGVAISEQKDVVESERYGPLGALAGGWYAGIAPCWFGVFIFGLSGHSIDLNSYILIACTITPPILLTIGFFGKLILRKLFDSSRT